MVGVSGSGKKWLIKNLGILLQCIIFKPGDLVLSTWTSLNAFAARCSDTALNTEHQINGRIISRIFRSAYQTLGNNSTSNVFKFKDRAGNRNHYVHFTALTVFFGNAFDKKDVMVLVDGDPIQMATRRNGEQHYMVPFLVKPEFSIACPGFQYVVFEKTMHFRIQD